jgi:hypothetical protein
MLITFKSKSSPELLMYQEHAQRILDLLQKNPARGVITAAEAGAALAALEKEVADSKLQQQAEAAARKKKEEEEEEDEGENTKKPAPVGFSARAYPLLEMLRTAEKNGHDITWGV